MALLDINLLAKQQGQVSRLNQANFVVGMVVAAVIGLQLLVLVFLVSAKAIRENEKQDTIKKTAELQTKIDKLNKETVAGFPNVTLAGAAKAYQANLQAAGSLVDNHKYFTLYLSEIALNTPPTVVYISFSSTGSNQISVTGSAATYTDVSKIAESFKGLSFAKKVAIQEAKQASRKPGETGNPPVRFTLVIELKPASELKVQRGTDSNAKASPRPVASSKPLPVEGATR